MTRFAAAALLAVYSGVVYNLTLMDPTSGRWAFGRADRIATVLSNGRLDWSQTEVLANAALFVPIGFLLAVALQRVWPAVLLGVLGSMFIEGFQAAYLPLRVATSADVVHNGYGAVLGAVLAWPLVTLLRHRAPSATTAGVPARLGP